MSATDDMYGEFALYVGQAWNNLIGVPGETEFVQSIVGIPDENIGKLLRMYRATKYYDEWCLITDVDMLPLNAEYFVDGSEQAKEEHILYYTRELEGVDKGKYPICYMLAQGKTFRKYINPSMLSFHELLETWVKYGVDKLPFSDESLYRELLHDAPKIILERDHRYHRINRPNCKYDQKKLDSGYYIDFHLPRPLNENMEVCQKFFSMVGVKL
jgi:hypothetical protein